MRPLSKECELILKRYFFPEDIVIVSPLNWGIGHATRCIPLIHFLKKYCREVIIASDGQALEILKREFSDLTTYETPSYNIKYKYENALLNMLAMLPFIINGIIREKGSATMLTKKFNATVIFSDNRLGFLDKNVRNIYMTHQINILHPNRIISWIAGKLHQWFINKFDLCLVPDYQDFKRSVSGKLSFSKAVKNCQYLAQYIEYQLKPKKNYGIFVFFYPALNLKGLFWRRNYWQNWPMKLSIK